jgi:hypothetical protein
MHPGYGTVDAGRNYPLAEAPFREQFLTVIDPEMQRLASQ